MFAKYEIKFGVVRLQRTAAPGQVGKKKTAWGNIVGATGGSSFSSSVPSSSTSGSGTFASSVFDLTSYLDSDTVTQFDDDFNILNWWHEHKQSYFILSIPEKDVITVPVSTISLEAAFSLTGRIIEDWRRRLGSDMVEILALLKDWEQGEARAQHNIENKDLEDQFKNLYLDGGDGAANSVASV